jgi:RimJ/RimL family protein N-acetyltransferase
MKVRLIKLSKSHHEYIFKANTGNVKQNFIDFKTSDETRNWLINALKIINSGDKIEKVIFIDGNPVGMVSVRNLKSRPEIGIWVDENNQGRGIGKVALKLFIKNLQECGIKELFYTVDEDNLPSIALAVACGFNKIDTDQSEIKYCLKLQGL